MTPNRTQDAEAALAAAGYPQVRISGDDDVARVRVPERELDRFAEPEVREAVTRAVRGAGYRFVALDLDGE